MYASLFLKKTFEVNGFKYDRLIQNSGNIVYFGYPNLMLSLLQYISSYFNINMATFVGFQIAIYAYVVLRIFTYTNPSSPVYG